jgi:hypothetical protein
LVYRNGYTPVGKELTASQPFAATGFESPDFPDEEVEGDEDDDPLSLLPPSEEEPEEEVSELDDFSVEDEDFSAEDDFSEEDFSACAALSRWRLRVP